MDIWVSNRQSRDDRWQEPVNLGPDINTPESEWSPFVSFNQHTLFFARLIGDDPFNDDHNIWQVPIVPQRTGDLDGSGALDVADIGSNLE